MKKPKPKRKAKPYPPNYTKDTKPDGPKEIPEGYVPFDGNFFESNEKTPVVFDIGDGLQFCPVKATCEGPSKSDPGCYRFKWDHGYFPDVTMYGCLMNGGPLVAYFKRVTKETKPDKPVDTSFHIDKFVSVDKTPVRFVIPVNRNGVESELSGYVRHLDCDSMYPHLPLFVSGDFGGGLSHSGFTARLTLYGADYRGRQLLFFNDCKAPRVSGIPSNFGELEPFEYDKYKSITDTPVVFARNIGPHCTEYVDAVQSRIVGGSYYFTASNGEDLPAVGKDGRCPKTLAQVAFFKKPTAKDQKPEEPSSPFMTAGYKPFDYSQYRSSDETPVHFAKRLKDGRTEPVKAILRFEQGDHLVFTEPNGTSLPVVTKSGVSVSTGGQLAYFRPHYFRGAESPKPSDTTPRRKELKPGFWREEGGGKAEVVEVRDPSEKDGYVDPGKYVAIGWNSKGRAQKWNALGKTFVSSDDLVEPWVDRVEWNWEWAPPWFDWIMLGQRGDWYMFKDEPEHDCNGVVLPYGKHCFIPAEYAPKWTGDWRNSKTKRPSKP